MPSKPTFATLVELLGTRSAEKPRERLYSFVEESEGDETSCTYEALDARARRIAVALGGLERGTRVVLLYPPGLEYVAGFFGCLYAGLVAVPAYPPDPSRLERTLPRLQAIIQDSRATAVLTTSFILSMGEFLFEQAPDLKGLHWVATDALPEGGESTWRAPDVGPQSLAFLQYTSGSTGTPKGVMLSHANLLHNLQAIHQSFRAGPDSTGVIWLPPYHDMGLIGGILEPLYGAFPTVLMSPLTFLKRPQRWLEAISRHRGTISGGPNFAFDLCVRRIPEQARESLDLSSWEVAFCGAEPLRTDTLERFKRAFGPRGFQQRALYPCYGLAEGTLLVTGVEQGTGAVARTLDTAALEHARAVEVAAGTAGARELVACGPSLPDQELLIVHPEARTRCAEGELGEIWVRGPSVAQGYWQRPELSEATFQARLEGGGEAHFLRTGDLGFLLHGELFVAGRLKDLVILRGRNHYPQDLELTAEQSHPALRPGCGAAFAVDVEGEERLVLVQEVDSRQHAEPAEVLAALRQALSEHHEVQAHAVLLLEPGSIPKTSSGKIQRHACRAGFLSGALRTVAAWKEGPASVEPTSPSGAVASPEPDPDAAPDLWLRSRVAARLRLSPEEVSLDEPITQLGLDSLAAVELSHEIEKGLGVVLPMAVLLQGPSVAELAERVRAWRARAVSEVLPPLTRGARHGEPLLSFSQLRLWFLDELERGSPAYNISAAVRLEGTLDVEALERSFSEVVRRHETLRTAFVTREGVPVQRIADTLPLVIPHVDLRSVPAAEREAAAVALAREEALRPFDLSVGPLLRITLARTDAHAHVLVLVLHHIVSDGWSMGVLVKEVGALYAAYLRGAPSPLPALPIQYADWAGWQRDWLEGGALEAQQAWWRERLRGAPPALELPTDRPRLSEPSFRGHTVPARLSSALSEDVKALAKREGLTPFMVLLAGWQVLLARYAGQQDVCVGTPVAGRTRPEVEGLIGFFVNTLVLRTELTGNPSFHDVLGRVREMTLGAYAHQDVPFEKLVEALRPARDLGRTPLFQAMLAFQQDPLPELSLPGLALRPVALDTGLAKFEVSLNLSDTREGFAGVLQCSADLFEATTGERMVRHLCTLLEAAVARPELRVAELPLLDAAERRQVLVAWNDSRLGLPDDACLHQLFEAQVARVPGHVAIVAGGQSLTYRELNARANQLAGYLCTLGVGPDVPVGLCLERRVEALVGLLGILKAGGAYVPLDPAFPAERLRQVLEDAGARVVVTAGALHECFQGHCGTVVRLDVDTGTLARFSEESGPSFAAPGNLAYVIFTSGSTGRPKGVAIEHRQIVRYVRGIIRRLSLPEGASHASVSTLAADLGHTAVFPALAQGGTLHLVATDVASDSAALGDYFERHGVDCLKIVPSHLRALLASELPARLLPRQRLVLGGEAADWALIDQVRGLAPGCEVFNHYGPTETTVGVLTLPASAMPVEARPAAVPLGRPVPDVQAYVLDAFLRPVPVGVIGGLYIGGALVGRGYLGQPELTAERFVPSPYGDVAGARLYRTGDRARLRPDGCIEFLGRDDDQLKVRGFRVEPGEVEAVLKQHPAVREAVVVVREAGPGDRRLVAHVTAVPGSTPDVGTLKAFLEARLPAYLVPSALGVLEALPLTANGKVDRRALPALVLGSAQPDAVAPRTPFEEVLAGIWAGLLGVERVGVHDDFFALGGHSLLATRVVSRIRQAFRVELPLRTLFEAPTVAALARRLETLSRAGEEGPRPGVVPVPRTGPLPLSFAQQRLWFLDRMEPGNPFYNVPAVLWLEGALDADALESALREIVRRHEVLRTTFRDAQDGPVQVIGPAPERVLTQVDLTSLPTGERERRARTLVREEALRPFDLIAGPPLRATLLRVDAQSYALTLVMHHIVADGWSLGVLVHELGALYAAAVEGRPSPLPELPIQYADHAVWQRGWLRGAVLDAQLSWWRERLQGAPQLLELPMARPRPRVGTYQGAQRTLRLPREVAEAVRHLALREGATPFMVLMAAFQALLHRYTGQTDLLVGTDIANRHHAETEPLVGFFVNQLVLRGRPSAAGSFRELVAQVREAALGAYAHQDLPFEELVRDLRPERSLGASPLFQVKLLFQNARDVSLELPGVRLRVEPMDLGAAKFDLTVAFSDTGEGLTGLWEYSADLFDEATVARMQDHLRTLLQGALADPERRLSELPLLTGPERDTLLVAWNDTSSPLPDERRVHRLFEAVVARTPDAVAVDFEGQTLTYRALDARANQLAHHLRALGVGHETPVGVCLERSPELVVALLGILKAGSAFLPLEPANPSERLGFMLQDAGVPVVVTQSHLADELPSLGQLVCLDEEARHIDARPSQPPDLAGGPEHLAYVIYTSGSTGRPKGTLLTHLGLSNTALTVARAHGVRPDSRVLQFASIGFDAAVCEVFSTLLAGARLCLAPRDALLPGDALAETLRARAITTVTLTPAVLAQQEPEDFPSLETVISAGEACTPEVVRRWSTGRRFINAYGPTEVTVCATLTPGPVSPERVSIGRPITNVRVFVLDDALQPVPVGVPGGLYVGGEGVARGYLRRPELTAERFVPDPFGPVPGARLYRTGDRVRWLDGGELEFVGREDDQVKVRGFRIELGEVEAVLGAQPGVRACAVAVREDVPGVRRLVAYGVAEEGSTPDTAALRESLGQRLPEYMVPTAFVWLEALPLTTSGKVDRRALPAPETVAPRAQGSFAEPFTPAEKLLASIWAQVLRVERVGAHDSFFELGGDSIIGLQVISRARQAGLALTPKQLFEHQRLADLAAVAVSEAALAQDVGPVVGEVPLTPIQRWFFERELPEPHHYNQALLLSVREPLDAAALEGALRALWHHHDALRMRFALTGGGWVQRIPPPDDHLPRLVREDLSLLPVSERSNALEAAAARVQAEGDLVHGPLMRAVLFSMGPEYQDRLLLVVHHLVVDGVSWRTLLEDLESAYRRQVQGLAPELPPRTTSFKAWSEQLHTYAAKAELSAETEFWRAQATRPVEPLRLDVSGGANTVASARVVSVMLDEEATLLLREASVAWRARLDELLLASVMAALRKGLGAERVRVLLEGHGREAPFEGVDLSRTVGWFTAAYPVVLEVPGRSSEGDTLRLVRDAVRSVPGRGLSFGVLRHLREDETTRLLREMPAAAVAFNYLGQFDGLASEISLFEPAREGTGPTHGPGGLRSQVLEVGGRILGGCLRLDWTYSEHLHQRATVEALARSTLEALRALVAQRTSPDTLRYTPADFPLAKAGSEALARVLPPGVAVEDLYPLSPLQEGLLFHGILSGGVGAYFEQVSCAFHAPLNVQAFRHAWQEAVAQVPVLRTAFRWQGLARPLQVVLAHVELPWRELDWRDVPPREQQERLQALLAEDRARGLDLTQAPLMRMVLIRMDERVHHLVWSFHHLLMDGWSVGLLLRQVFSFYESFGRGETPRVARAPAFREYISWLGRQDLGAAEQYWRQELAGFERPTPLPEDRAPGRTGATRHLCRLSLSAASTAALQDFARQHQLTLNTLVQAAWALMLGRSAGVDDVVFGATVSGRPADLEGVESMVGLLINSLPVRMRLPPGERLQTWLQELQRRQAGQRQYEFSPLVDVQGWSGLPRGTTLFEGLLVFENYPLDSAVWEWARDLDVRDFVVSEWTNYPLTLVVAPGRELQLKLLHDSGRFDADAASGMLAHLRALLEGFVAQPDARLDAVSMLPAEERRRLLTTWNRSQDFAREPSVHHLFEAQAARAPDAVAVTYEGAALTYGELNRRANQLAHHLRARGVGPEVLVGLCVERSLDMLVGLLGILKAGGAYLPLDPTYPKDRLSFMLEDASVALLLTQERLVASLPQERTLLCLDSDWERIAREPEHDPVHLGTPENLSYVIYTSGSTGRPKGMQICHAEVARLFAATEPWFHFGPEDVWTLFHSYAFDFSVWEIWGALIHGGRLVVVPYLVSRSPESFHALLCREQVTVLNQTPSAFRQLIHADAASGSAGALRLRWVIFGGEALEFGSLAPWFARHGEQQPRLVNMYGITETTVHVTYRPVSAADAERAATHGVGVPIPDLQVYVLDAKGDLAPVGVVGELFVGGEGLGRGYLGRPELTAQRFIPDPFSGRPGARLYRTGDLGRWRSAGELDHLGRIDNQVKLRGFRIELGEVEAALLLHPGVQDAVALVREVSGDKRLVAYVVPRAGVSLDTQELRRALRDGLPDYMVPAAIVPLASLPLTSNGKLAREALPAPESMASSDEAMTFVPPRTPTEEIVAGVWAQVLGVARVGATDSFFELGGHSLLATQVASRLREVFPVDVPLRELFERPTVAELARWIDTAIGSGTRRLAELPLVARPRSGAPPLSFAQQRLWFLDRLSPESVAYNVQVALRLEGTLDVGALERGLAEVVRRHESLRTTFGSEDGRPFQVIAAEATLPLALVDLQQLPAEERLTEARRLANEEARRPFDLQAGPLLRATLVRVEDREHVLVLVMHHIVSDGWSMGVLVKEVAELYRAYLVGAEARLGALEVQYADWAQWQREWLEGGELESQLGWWRERLRNAPTALALPTDRPRPVIQSSAGASHALALSREVSEGVRELARREGVTPFMVLLAAWQVLLSRHAGQEEVCVGTPIAGRTRMETEGLIGFFVNTLVLMTRVEGQRSFRELLARVRETTLGAYAHQDVPFEKLVEALQPARDLSRHPLFQVLFTLQNAPLGPLVLPSLEVHPLELERRVSKFDLALALSDHDSGFAGSLEYSADLFEAGTVARMVSGYRRVLEALVAHPEARVGEVELLEGGEREQVLVEWNRTAKDYAPRSLCAHEVFEARAEATPGAEAVRSGDGRSLSYGELEARANRLAHVLRGQGVGPEVRVALYLERSVELVVGMLAVLKAGGAYVPVDPSLPAQRAEWMLQEAGVEVVLTEERLAPTLPARNHKVVCLDLDAARAETEPAGRVDSAVGPEHLAYVIFTSGSTGQPKGVMVRHGGLANTALAVAEAHGVRADDRVLQYASPSFDASVCEVFSTLAAGASVCVASREALLPGDALADTVRRLEVTVVTLTPSVLRQQPLEGLEGVRTLISAGEACPADVVRRWKPGRRMLNGYGPTEVTVCATVSRDSVSEERVTLGGPLANARVYVLDDGLCPVPVGVAGELYVGGEGVARGYLGRPELTAERFVPDAFSTAPGARLYRTGDVVRWVEGGELEYVGRRDGQVKVRGMRLELGEVEAALARCPDVKDAVVVADTAANGRLVAYVVGAADVGRVREWLRERLPEYMVPAAFMVLEALPLTSNGKVDRRALPAPRMDRAASDEAFVPPTTELEQRLAKLWQEVLQVERVGLRERFFDLGGNSLSLVQVHSRMRGQLGIDVPLTELFQHASIGALVARLSERSAPSGAEEDSAAAEERFALRQARTGQRRQSRRRADESQQEDVDE